MARLRSKKKKKIIRDRKSCAVAARCQPAEGRQRSVSGLGSTTRVFGSVRSTLVLRSTCTTTASLPPKRWTSNSTLWSSDPANYKFIWLVAELTDGHFPFHFSDAGTASESEVAVYPDYASVHARTYHILAGFIIAVIFIGPNKSI